jgi:fibronectin type 3 domain-containing protein
VSLRWNPSTSTVAGYNVYRSSAPGGPYARINPVVAASTNYQDSSVQGGKTYYYVSTAVSTGGIESKYSGQFQAAIPTP